MASVYTRRRLLVVAVVSVLPIAVWTRSRTSATSYHDIAAAPGQSTTGSAPLPATTSTSIPAGAQGVAAVEAGAVEPTGSVPPLDHDLSLGMTDPKVTVLQSRLIELAFDPGPADGYFGEQTLRSVWAFDKLVAGTPREQVSGVVSPVLWDAVHGPVDITARRDRGGTHVEVYLPEQVAVVFTDGSPRLVTHVSTGDGEQWCQEVTIDNDDGTQSVKGRCGISTTPGGVYHFERKIDGWRNAALGRLYKPVYFNYGIAIHGATNVPNQPASRGCVRTPMHIAEYFPDLVGIGDDVFVFDGVKEPEHYGAQLPVFDWPDPDWIDPNSTTTTTTTTTTVPSPPSTSAAPMTTPATTAPQAEPAPLATEPPADPG